MNLKRLKDNYVIAKNASEYSRLTLKSTWQNCKNVETDSWLFAESNNNLTAEKSLNCRFFA